MRYGDRMSANQYFSSADSPLVSIVVPAYNAEPYFEECLKSIEGQTYSKLEIIVVDDGSTDETLDIARSHAENDPRITVVAQRNQYAGVARNNGMEIATGEYYLFFDADDILEARAVELLVERAVGTGADVTVCRSTALDVESGGTYPLSHALCDVDIDSVVSGLDLREKLFQIFVGWPWDKLFKSSFIHECGLRFQPLRTTNDAFFVYMAMVLSERIAFVDHFGVIHRVGNGASLEGTRRKSYENAMIAAKAIRDELGEKGLYPSFERTYLNWLVHFSAWNLQTLDSEAQDDYFELMLDQLKPLLPESISEGYFYRPQDAGIAAMLRMSERNLLKRAILLESSQADLLNRIADLEEERERIYKQWGDDVERCAKEKEEILSSSTYRIGKLVMAIPCSIKDAMRKR